MHEPVRGDIAAIRVGADTGVHVSDLVTGSKLGNSIPDGLDLTSCLKAYASWQG